MTYKFNKIYDPEALGLKVIRKTGDELLCQCPYHNDSHPSSTYNIEKGVFYCFTCKESKSAPELARDLGGHIIWVSEIEAYKKEYGEDSEWLNLLKNPLAISVMKPGIRYLMKRQVLLSQVRDYEIREASNGVVFPLKNKLGRVVGCLTRQFDQEPRYLFSGQRPPIWPYNNIYEQSLTNNYIVEGVFGVLRFEQFNQNAIASMGTGYSLEIAQIAKTNISNPISYFDPDYAGRLAAGKLLLLGIPAAITEVCADEISYMEQITECEVTYDVMTLIENSPEQNRLQRALEKFWRKL